MRQPQPPVQRSQARRPSQATSVWTDNTQASVLHRCTTRTVAAVAAAAQSGVYAHHGRGWTHRLQAAGPAHHRRRAPSSCTVDDVSSGGSCTAATRAQMSELPAQSQSDTDLVSLPPLPSVLHRAGGNCLLPAAFGCGLRAMVPWCQHARGAGSFTRARSGHRDFGRADTVRRPCRPLFPGLAGSDK